MPHNPSLILAIVKNLQKIYIGLTDTVYVPVVLQYSIGRSLHYYYCTTGTVRYPDSQRKVIMAWYRVM